MVTARFLVGTSADAAILRVHDKVRANMDRIPVGVPEPLIVGRGIDDVAIVSLTLSPKPEAADRISANDLTRIARELRTEIAKIDNVGLTYLVGETGEMIRIAPDPAKLALYGVTLQQLAGKVQGANRAFPAGQVRDDGEQIELVAGETLRSPAEIGNLLLTTRDGRPVYVRDVADVDFATDTSDALVSTRHARRGRASSACRPSRWPSPSAPAPTPSSWPRRSCTGSSSCEGDLIPRRHRGRGHARLWRDGQREGQRTALSSRSGDRVDHRCWSGWRSAGARRWWSPSSFR